MLLLCVSMCKHTHGFVWNISKQSLHLAQVYLKGQGAYWSSHSSIKDLTHYFTTSTVCCPGAMWTLPEFYDKNMQI